MNKARRIFKNPDARAQKRRIIGTGQPENGWLVRNGRRHYPHIHTPFGRRAQRVSHHVVHYQVRRKYVDIFFRLMENVQIYIFRNGFVIQGRIGIGLHEALSLKRLRMMHMRLEAADIRILFPEGIPHFQEHLCKIPHAVAL